MTTTVEERLRASLRRLGENAPGAPAPLHPGELRRAARRATATRAALTVAAIGLAGAGGAAAVGALGSPGGPGPTPAVPAATGHRPAQTGAEPDEHQLQLARCLFGTDDDVSIAPTETAVSSSDAGNVIFGRGDHGLRMVCLPDGTVLAASVEEDVPQKWPERPVWPLRGGDGAAGAFTVYRVDDEVNRLVVADGDDPRAEAIIDAGFAVLPARVEGRPVIAYAEDGRALWTGVPAGNR